MTSQAITPARARLMASYRNLALWTFQGWLAMFFVAAGYAKLTEPMDNLIQLMRWPGLVAPDLVRGLGIAEIVLSLMVLAPLVSWKHGGPSLILAAGVLIVLEGAMLAFHLFGGDVGPALTNAILLAITAPVLRSRAREHRGPSAG